MTNAPQISLNRTATPEEAAAITAAIQRFTADTALPPATGTERPDPWLTAALEDGVNAASAFGPGDPFGI